MNPLLFLLTATIVFGLLGAAIHYSLSWGRQAQNDRVDLFYVPILGLACIILIVTGLGVFKIQTDSASLLISTGGVFLGPLIFLLHKIRKHPLHLTDLKKEHYLMGILLLVISIAKLIEIRAILVPNWVDGLVHVTILQKLVQKGFIPIERIYHTGFHAAAIFIHFIFGISLSNTILWFGQWVALLTGLSFYAFLRRNRVHFLLAFLGAILYCMVFLFPSYLIAWGRYPFLLGLALVFPSINTTLDWVKNKHHYFEALILLCALALVHYGALLIWFSYLVSYFLSTKRRKMESGHSSARLVRFVSLFLLPLAFLLPKGLNFISQKSLQVMLAGKLGNPDFGGDIWIAVSLIQKHDLLFLAITFSIILSALLLKWKPTVRFAAWPIVLFSLIWAQYATIGFSITSYINALIFLSGPVVILCMLALQYIFVQASKIYGASKPYARQVFIPMVLAGISVIGIFSSWNLITPGTTLFTFEDSMAMKWIQSHTSQDATFFIQSFIWGDELMPSDGGGWIPVLTGRNVIYPTTVGEFQDMAEYSIGHNVNYVYFGRESDPDFKLRLEDINTPYQVVFQTKNIMILKLNIP
ncbi:MAG: hypothetical protein HYZ25_12580 [Chloroflexi bacterium]|nr:hypothetical protein [Chloroflexota bacterium]